MKYEKCLTCDQLGVSCDGPNLLSMDTAELGLWCKTKFLQNPSITYDKVAAETGIAKSTVYGFLNGSHSDYRLETIRPIAKMVTGGKWDDNPCGYLSNSEKVQYDEAIRKYEAEIKWRDDIVRNLEKQNELLEHQLNEKDITIKERGVFLRRKDKWIVLLVIMVLICLNVIIGALAADHGDPNLGFIWRDLPAAEEIEEDYLE